MNALSGKKITSVTIFTLLVLLISGSACSPLLVIEQPISLIPSLATLPTIASAPVPQSTAVPTDLPAPLPVDQTLTYTSDQYHYQFSYPADWRIQVDKPVYTGPGSNPEYVTITTSDPSNLPSIQIYVLTDEPPLLGFEDCVRNFVFRDLPACKFSLPAGQHPATEVWIFEKGTANFFIGMLYQGTEPVQTFTDFLSSFVFK